VIILINDYLFGINKDNVTFEDLIKLVGKPEYSTVIYGKGPQENQEGLLLAGQSVKIKEGMIFSIVVTGNA
jgi:hypothetical protein